MQQSAAPNIRGVQGCVFTVRQASEKMDTIRVGAWEGCSFSNWSFLLKSFPWAHSPALAQSITGATLHELQWMQKLMGNLVIFSGTVAPSNVQSWLTEPWQRKLKPRLCIAGVEILGHCDLPSSRRLALMTWNLNKGVIVCAILLLDWTNTVRASRGAEIEGLPSDGGTKTNVQITEYSNWDHSKTWSRQKLLNRVQRYWKMFLFISRNVTSNVMLFQQICLDGIMKIPQTNHEWLGCGLNMRGIQYLSSDLWMLSEWLLSDFWSSWTDSNSFRLHFKFKL